MREYLTSGPLTHEVLLWRQCDVRYPHNFMIMNGLIYPAGSRRALVVPFSTIALRRETIRREDYPTVTYTYALGRDGYEYLIAEYDSYTLLTHQPDLSLYITDRFIQNTGRYWRPLPPPLPSEEEIDSPDSLL